MACIVAFLQAALQATAVAPLSSARLGNGRVGKTINRTSFVLKMFKRCKEIQTTYFEFLYTSIWI